MTKLFFVDRNSNKYYSILESLTDKNYDARLFVDITSENYKTIQEVILDKLSNYGFVKKNIIDSCIYSKVNYKEQLDESKLKECFNNFEYIKLVISKGMIENINLCWLKKIVLSTEFYGDNYNEFEDDYRLELMVKSSDLSLEQFIDIYIYSYSKTNNIFLAGFKDNIIFFKVSHNIFDIYYLEKSYIKESKIKEGYLFLEVRGFNTSICEFIKKSEDLKIDYVLFNYGKFSLACNNRYEVTINDSLYKLFKNVEGFTEFDIS